MKRLKYYFYRHIFKHELRFLSNGGARSHALEIVDKYIFKDKLTRISQLLALGLSLLVFYVALQYTRSPLLPFSIGLVGAVLFMAVAMALRAAGARREIRRLINKEGRYKVCICCGYRLDYGETDSCPECGACQFEE